MNRPQPDQRRALVAGCTGLVGGLILQALLADRTVTQVHALSRRAFPTTDLRLQVHVVDFLALPELPQIDEVYLALGTTIKVAGSQAAFRAVDLDASMAVAEAAHRAGARRFGLVSAAGANAGSPVFYSRVKGELEVALKAMDMTALVIAQPSLLLGDRASLDQPTRVAERLITPIAGLIGPWLPHRWQPVQARAVAQALVRTVPSARGTVVLPSQVLARTGA